MRSFFIASCAAAVAALTIGCGGGDSYEIADGDLSGMIGGESWTYKSAWTDDFLSDEERFFTQLYDVDAEACGFGPTGTKRTVLMMLPREPGEYKLGFSQNVTLAVDSDNKIATLGRMVVESVTDTEVEVGLYAIFGDDTDFEVSGHFTATICPSTTP